MPVDILVALILTTIIQSIFGVGILLFGTPLLLLLGYDFSYALTVLLPISIAVNMLQVVKHYSYINVDLYKSVLIYSIPFIIFFLFIISNIQINIALLIGGFLLFVAVKNFFPRVEQSLRLMIQYEKIYLMLMGIVHGITNLGGSLLTALVHEQGHSKNITRVTIAICYATFAVFQLLTLYLIGYENGMTYTDNMLLLQICMVVFLVTEEFLYTQIDNQIYTRLFAIFLAISGVLLIIKSFNS